MTRQYPGRQYTPKPSAQEQILSSAEKSYKDKIKEEYYNIWLMQQILKKKSVH